MPQSGTPHSNDEAPASKALELNVTLDADGSPVLSEQARKILRAYSHANIRFQLRDEALRSESIGGEEIQLIADTQKLDVEVVVYSLGGEGLARGDLDLANKLTQLL